jgi:DNA-binding response OmpR family regulator
MTSPQRAKVLVVDDDAALRALCAAALDPAYEVVGASNGRDGLRAYYELRPDAVLLDLTMPELDGWQTCARIRELSDVPIIMLTAHGGPERVARGLDAGADDYVLKPFSPTELAARLRAVLRRPRPSAAAPQPITLRGGELVVDPARCAAIVRGRDVALTANEYRVLELLARHAGQVLSQTQILDRVWGTDDQGGPGHVKTYINLLRNKLEADPARPRLLLTRRGLGYVLHSHPAI